MSSLYAVVDMSRKKNRASSQNVYATVHKIKSEVIRDITDGDDGDYADIEVFTANNSSMLILILGIHLGL